MAAFRPSSTGWTLCLAILAILSCLVVPGEMVKHENFKTCSQSGFCSRNRAYADTVSSQGSSWSAPYHLESNSIQFANGQLLGIIVKTIENNEKVNLPLTVSFLQSGVARVTVDEEKRIQGDIQLRHDRKIRKERYNEAEKWVIVGGLELSSSAEIAKGTEAGITKVHYGPDNKFQAVIRHSPFEVHFQRDGETHIQLNDKGLLNVEHWRPKVEKPTGDDSESEPQDAVDDSTWWEESFGGNTDTKPRGPESVGLDITFPGYNHVFGIPEHADSLSLKETRGGDGHHTEPYRLYNSDVFEYELNSPMTLYGSIPFMQAHRKGSTVGVLWLNAAETWVDIVKTKASTNPLALGVVGKTSTQTHWFSEAGQLDVFVFLGPTPQALSKSYGELTGFTQLPQHFAIGYHQCRWNYVTDEDVRDVDRKFDLYQIPYDVIWLDIEYTDHKKYFTWDPLTFPDPDGMQKQLDDSGRKLVIIVDPHIKNEANYPVVDELKSKGLGVKNKDGDIYDGWCWPGSSHWIDCFNPAAVSWWSTLFKYDKFKGTHSNMFIWNDMNEPSVFNGPETTMPKDNIHHGGWEHRDLHNLNGMTFINATYHAMLERKKGEVRRPFVLTRSFYAGTQRVGAMWTGDNQANWEHLAASLPMVLNNGIAGFPFAGADVGGFFGNPSKELLTRWYQTGIFYPFFRAHAHIDTRRREPYLAGEPYMSIITQALQLRYQLLPAWYTSFQQASIDGSPIVQPQYYVHPEDEAGFAIDDQLYLGSTGLLAKPIVAEGATSTDIYLADDEKYYDYFDYTVYQGAGKRHTVQAPLEKIPLLMQGGHIIPRKDRPRRSSELMKWDPYTLVVTLDKNGQAEGTLYVDDGETFDYQNGAYIHRRFTFSESSLSSTDIGAKGTKTAQYLKTMAGVRVEKIIIVDAPDAWESQSTVLVLEEGSQTGSQASLQWHAKQGGKAAYAVVKDPGVSIGGLWKIDFS
ncbi:alpha 1,3-glucosidase [Blastomyces dermatitidis ER-3]|uniref:alpha-glucosidase n=3 Tax=Blastomyces TaxID=229219 RepID=A0A179UAY2_BLAGS|nr:alpha 1,3-glucosidase [Blastomyces gilchristii SLH14081]XP_045276222.1 alpha 1,3-glucosidase [Blastomyces dermatitidis ER-3]EGE82086.1 alpha 1,3-glucosidase [Blastomyces dermatitidis ATCC 18188]EQL33411.1 alpha 1,3-glucosidase [Blastomyces dermatitidis ATCC 26199]EEQ89263.1 alpha 1,3-glucosidase [Blastomyces dermatitidis ER-3]OAT04873.1 alpha 1,3-glucosidase [Blastomyces gilchristii SLH14081]